MNLNTDQLIDATYFSQLLADDAQHLDESGVDVELEFAGLALSDLDESGVDADVELEFAGIELLDLDANDYLFEPCMYHSYFYR